MHKLKELYSSPLSELLVVRFEENFLDSYTQGGGGHYGDDDTNDNGDF